MRGLITRWKIRISALPWSRRSTVDRLPHAVGQRRVTACLVFWGLVSTALLGGGAVPASAEEIAVIVNSRGPLVGLTREEVRAYYLGQRSFAGTERVEVLHLPEGRVKDAFLTGVLGTTAREYKLHWVKRLFREGGALPRVVPDAEAMIRSVEAQPATIGYVPTPLPDGITDVVELFRVNGP